MAMYHLINVYKNMLQHLEAGANMPQESHGSGKGCSGTRQQPERRKKYYRCIHDT